MPEITPIIAAFLLYIMQGETPANAVDMACIDVFPTRMEKNEHMTIQIARELVFSYLHPEIPDRIKLGAKLLQFSFLNFDSLAEGELDSINEYIAYKNSYFSV